MSEQEFGIEINLLDPKSPSILEIRVVDRAILSDTDLDFVLGHLPPESITRVDIEYRKPFLGIDIFYSQDASVRGLVFSGRSYALVVRIPDNATETSAAMYKEQQALASAAASKPHKGKGKPKAESPDVKVTPYDRLRRLLNSNLVAFGMAQISLTLWDTLHEKVDGVNLSTATSEKISPPSRITNDPNQDDDTKSSKEQDKGGNEGKSNWDGKGGRGDKGVKKGKGGRGNSRKENEGQKLKEGSRLGQGKIEPDLKAESPVLPDDEEPNWDRKILTPAKVVKKIYPDASGIDVNSTFMGQIDEASPMERIAEAATRAWLSFIVANAPELNQLIQDAPVVKPSRLTEKELDFFSKSMVTTWKVLGEVSPFKELSAEDYRSAGNKLESRNYRTKIRPGKNQALTVIDDQGEKLLFLANTSGKHRARRAKLAENESEEDEQPAKGQLDPNDLKSNGSKRDRKGQFRDHDEHSSDFQNPPESSISEAPLIDLSTVKSMSIYGREDPTMPERKRDAFILRLLEGRGSLHGPKYKDCAFIRRVWFPTQAQISIGEVRKAKNAEKAKKALPVKKERNAWMNTDWGDDTDEEEVARIQALSLAENPEDQGDETEDDELGSKLQPNQIPAEIQPPPNESQRAVVGRIVAPNLDGRTRATLVHGPPGTGKTSTIASAVLILARKGELVWIVAQSNVGIRNVADKLMEVEFRGFILLVAHDYYDWWKTRYKSLKDVLINTPDLRLPRCHKRVHASKVILCTLATLSSGFLEDFVYNYVPLKHLIIDEASQINMTSEFMHLFYSHRHTLKSVCWFGDPKQLPPYGWSEGTDIQDIFRVEHLQANSKLLDTSYRLPIPVAEYISKALYNSLLIPWEKHPVKVARKAVVFVDVQNGKEEKDGTSWMNEAEADFVGKMLELYYPDALQKQPDDQTEYDHAIITPYEGQRGLLETKLKVDGIGPEVYNVDSFQGNEAKYIITSIAKTGGPGFLTSKNRLNVLLTRCKRGLIVVSQKDFVSRAGGLLQGLWFSFEPYDPWVSAEDVLAGYVDLPGSPAPNVRPPPAPKPSQSVPPSRTNMPVRPGVPAKPLAAQVVQQGARQPPVPAPSAATTGVKGVWGQKQGVDRLKKK